METKMYSNDEITVLWRQHLCTHSTNCWRGLGDVFRPTERPWISLGTSPTQSIIDQVGKCPSGALTWQKLSKTDTMNEFPFTVNEDRKRFEFDVDGHQPIIEFIRAKDNVMYLTHTEVPAELEGKGVGKKIVVQALQYIKDHNMTLAPLCPFVSAYVKRHPEWQPLVAEAFRN